MPKFNVDDYVMVEDRIKKFREKHPDGQIKTELVASTPDLQSVIVKAEVYDKVGNMLGSDLAQDHQGTHNFANEYSWVEVATTSAIGRALFNAGFQKSNGEKKASREEMQKVVNKQEQTKKEVAKITSKSAEKFAEDIGAKKKSVGDQLNDILKEMIPNKNKMQEIKTKVYNDMTKNTEVNEDVNNWTKKDMDKFLNRVEVALEDEDLVDVVIGSELKGEDMTDIPSGAWEQEPPTDKQLKTFNDKVAQATDDGQTELVKKAKDFLASGKATKKNIFDWIDTDGDWTLKDGS
tara:strand:+ start:164 stop:1039 length:876 start_codon:yes stop_codon:yes gene_type:complete